MECKRKQWRECGSKYRSECGRVLEEALTGVIWRSGGSARKSAGKSAK